LREEDLEGHMPNAKNGAEETPEHNRGTEKGMKAKMLVEKDNQVRHALELLRTWGIFSKIKGGS
jgi:hypothetical protein